MKNLCCTQVLKRVGDHYSVRWKNGVEGLSWSIRAQNLRRYISENRVICPVVVQGGQRKKILVKPYYGKGKALERTLLTDRQEDHDSGKRGFSKVERA